MVNSIYGCGEGDIMGMMRCDMDGCGRGRT